MILMAAILKMTIYRKLILISADITVFLDIKIIDVDTNILSLAMIEADIWAKYDFDFGHFENGVIQETHLNF